MIPLEAFFNTSQQLINRTPQSFKRYLCQDIDFKQPLILITGMRGVGKTTLLLQHLANSYKDNPSNALYLSADDLNLSNHRLIDIAESFQNNYAGKTLVIDEVHKYPDWQQELKNIHDLQNLNVIASGSSSLEITRGQYDLSRRSLRYSLSPLSLREYLNLSHDLNLPALSLEDLTTKHLQLSQAIITTLQAKDLSILERFNAYLKEGAYPYFQAKERFDYYQQVTNAVNKVLYEDIPSIFKMNTQGTVTLQRILNVVTSSEPYEPNVESLSRNLGIAKETTYNYLDYLHESGILLFLARANKGMKVIRKPAKIYLASPTLYHALGQIKGLQVQQGTLRESFFLSQVKQTLTSHETADIEIHTNPPLIVEIRGKGKTRKQLKHQDNAYLALDGLEYGINNSIPLWLFGFLY